LDFKGKTAVITGSSGGIGRGLAIALAKEGADIVLASRNTAKMEEVKKEITTLGRRVVAVSCDMTRDADVFRMRDAALQAFGNIDIYINNAAAGVRGYLNRVSIPDWEYIINTNLLGYIRGVQAFLPHFLERKSGYIVNVSSIQALGFAPDVLNIPYITTKAGILGFTESLYNYLSPLGIKVSCLVPGGVNTDINPNSRFVGTPEEIAKIHADDAVFLKLPFFLSTEQLAAGCLEGMRKEDYVILVPDSRPMLKAQGRDIDVFNSFVKQAVDPKNPKKKPF
jgi:NAD(P)-dependent dehydrogenase (short-subunit alcohol dehydrogenase family)